MKKTLRKLLICILIILIINNFFLSNISFADDGFGEWLEDMLGAVVGLLTWPVRIIALACAWAIDGLTTSIALLEGYVDPQGNIVTNNPYGEDEFSTLTPFHILFNKVALLDVNFFNILDNGSVVSNIRNSIAGWYYVMRMIAASILLCILIYVGIRMAITTIASDKAAYKKMLVDWCVSLALIFLLQYIILFTFAVNEALVKAMASISNSTELVNAMKNIGIISQGISAASIAATIAFCMLTAQTLGLLISYFNRMLKIAFLIIISPLITLTYSIDKMGDGKAQALNTWLKEFIYTVLLQSFHCIIYTVFVGMALSILDEGRITELAQLLDADQDSITIAGSVLAVFCIKFTKDAEKILGKIFDFSSSTSDSSLAVGMAASAMALSKAKGIGKGARSAVNGLKGAKGALGNAIRTTKVEAMALGAMVHGARNADGSRKTFAEAKDDAEAKVAEAEAEKEELKNAKKYGVSTKANDAHKDAKEGSAEKAAYDKAKAYEKRVADLTQANKDKGMSESLAKAKARAQVAKETRADNVRKNPKGAMDKAKHLWKYNKVRGTISAVKNVASQSEVLKEFGKLGRMSIAAGIGTFVGGATYGASGNAFNAFSLGAATYKGSKEFMQSSTKTLTNEMSQLFRGAGYEDVADASKGINSIMQRSDSFEKADDSIDEIFKKLENELNGLNDREKKDLRSKIKNVVNDEMTRNPSATNKDIMQKLLGHSEISQKLGAKPDANGNMKFDDNIAGHLNSFSTFKREKAIYDKVKTAGDIGVSPDAFIQSSLDRFENDQLVFGKPTESSDDARDREKIITAIEDGNISDDMMNAAINSPEQRKAFEKAVEDEINTLRNQQIAIAETGVYDPTVIAEIEEKIKNLQEKMVVAAGKDQEYSKEAIEKLDGQVENLKKDIETKAQEASKAIEDARTKIGQEARELEQEASWLEQEASRLEAQKRELEALKQYHEKQRKNAASMIKRYETTPDDNS